ncbi:hypothetical protein D3C77_530740 [compost metagenome]
MSAMSFDCRFDRLRLQDLAHIQERLEISRFRQILSHIFLDQLVASAVLLVSKHDLGLQLQLLFLCIFQYGIQFRKGLKAIFAHESANFLIVVIKRFYRMPHAPIMNIPFPRYLSCMLILISGQAAQRRGRPVIRTWRPFIHGLRQNSVEHRLIICPDLLPNLGAVIFLLPAPACAPGIMRPSGVDFIISTP